MRSWCRGWISPQRHGSSTPQRRQLLERRALLVDEAQRLREHARADHGARHNAFVGIRAVNEALAQQDHQHINAVRHQLAELDARGSSEAVASSREYFFCLFSSQRLKALRSTILETPR